MGNSFLKGGLLLCHRAAKRAFLHLVVRAAGSHGSAHRSASGVSAEDPRSIALPGKERPRKNHFITINPQTWGPFGSRLMGVRTTAREYHAVSTTELLAPCVGTIGTWAMTKVDNDRQGIFYGANSTPMPCFPRSNLTERQWGPSDAIMIYVYFRLVRSAKIQWFFHPGLVFPIGHQSYIINLFLTQRAWNYDPFGCPP